MRRSATPRIQIHQKGKTMIERIDDMPPGTIGFRARGKLTREDYRNILEPVLHEAAESGEIRMLFTLTDFEGLEPAAWFDDIKTGLGLGIGHHSAWKRSAIATNVAWVGKAYQMFAWMTPGEVKVYGMDGIEEAKSWVAA
jgi:SpoIIAA-like